MFCRSNEDRSDGGKITYFEASTDEMTDDDQYEVTPESSPTFGKLEEISNVVNLNNAVILSEFLVSEAGLIYVLNRDMKWMIVFQQQR